MSNPNLSLRVGRRRKAAYEDAARRMGWSSLSALVREVLDAVLLRVDDERWECRSVRVAGRELQVAASAELWEQLDREGRIEVEKEDG